MPAPVNLTQYLPAGIPTGYVSSTGDGPFDTDGAGFYEPSTVVDVNNADNGTQMGAMVMSKIVDLVYNSEPINDGDTDPNTNLTVDFGLYKESIQAPMTLGNLVWNDVNNNGIKEALEVGRPNVRVVLYAAGPDGIKGTADDVVKDSTLTNARGNYLFKIPTEG